MINRLKILVLKTPLKILKGMKCLCSCKNTCGMGDGVPLRRQTYVGKIRILEAYTALTLSIVSQGRFPGLEAMQNVAMRIILG